MDQVYLTATEAADYLGLSESYLAKLRMPEYLVSMLAREECVRRMERKEPEWRNPFCPSATMVAATTSFLLAGNFANLAPRHLRPVEAFARSFVGQALRLTNGAEGCSQRVTTTGAQRQQGFGSSRGAMRGAYSILRQLI